MFYKLIYIALVVLCVGCKSDVNNKKMTIASPNSIFLHTDSIREPQKNKSKKVFWKSVGYKKKESFNSDYDDNYAEEVSKFINFRLSQDTLQIGDCELNTYTYDYKTDLTYYGTESVFITEYKPQEEKVTFISIIDSGQEYSCFPFDKLMFYHPSNDKLVLFDRSYLFEFEAQSQEATTPSYIKRLEGIPGNNREEWLVEFEQENIADYSETLQFFKKEFPYGGKNLNSDWINHNNYQDEEHSVIYERSQDKIVITKSDPMGLITIELKLKNKTLNGRYKFEFPKD